MQNFGKIMWFSHWGWTLQPGPSALWNVKCFYIHFLFGHYLPEQESSTKWLMVTVLSKPHWKENAEICDVHTPLQGFKCTSSGLNLKSILSISTEYLRSGDHDSSLFPCLNILTFKWISKAIETLLQELYMYWKSCIYFPLFLDKFWIPSVCVSVCLLRWSFQSKHVYCIDS